MTACAGHSVLSAIGLVSVVCWASFVVVGLLLIVGRRS
jgi:hypothetical protein